MKRAIRAFLLILTLTLGVAVGATTGLIVQSQPAEAGPNP